MVTTTFSPHKSFSDKEEGTRLLNSPIQKLIKDYVENLARAKNTESPKIQVDEIASKVAFIYERIIKIVDWKEENLLRRNAIERFLKRNLIFELSKVKFIPAKREANFLDSSRLQENTPKAVNQASFLKEEEGNFPISTNLKELGEPLIRELVRGGHLPNNEISQKKVFEVQKIIEKYLFFLQNVQFKNTSLVFKKKVNFYNWLLSIAACEIEDCLFPPFKENGLIEAMTETLVEKIKQEPKEVLTKKEVFIQTCIAVHRTLFDLDEAIVSYHLLKIYYPLWTNPSREFLEKTAGFIFEIWEGLEKDLNHFLGKDFYNLCEQVDTVFTLIGDILEEFKDEPEKLFLIFSQKKELEKYLTKAYEARFTTLKSRLFKLAIFSSLSVFVSNWFSFFVVEVPLASLFYQGFSFKAAVFDFLIPTLTMFLLVSLIKPPKESNKEKALNLALKFIYQDGGQETYIIKTEKKKRPIFNFFIVFLYVLTCLLFLWGVGWFFSWVKIPWTSVILDTIGIALNIFAALVIRNKAKELTVEEKTGVGEFLLDILSLPVGEIGSWVAKKWKEYNVVSVFFNVILETPVVTLIDFLENWSQFLKERKASFH